MAEYISKEETLNIIPQYPLNYSREQVEAFMKGFYQLYCSVKTKKAADLRPVVLCRECRSYNRPRLGFCETHLVRMHGDDFCSYGRKREES